MSERHGEPLAPGDDSGWRIYCRDTDGEPVWIEHEPSGVTVWRYRTGCMDMTWGAVGISRRLQSSRITDACAEAMTLARRHLLDHLARLEGEQRSPDSEPDNGARPDAGSGV